MSFESQVTDAGWKRSIEIDLKTEMPVQGKTYAISSSSDAIVTGNSVLYKEFDRKETIKGWYCAGDVTFDSVSGTVHRFHLSVTCADILQTSEGKGSVTITATGAAKLP